MKSFIGIFLTSAFAVNTIKSEDLVSTLEDLSKCVTVPEVCPNENITFWLYTRQRQDNPHQLVVNDLSTILEAPFVKGRPIELIIHGYTGHKDYSPNTELRPALFKKGEFNIISVDYGPIAKEPCYIQAAKFNAKVVGNCTAQLVDILVEKAGIPLETIHVIGFSLGGQVAGLLTNYLQSGQLSHITGLDPAFPLFLTLDRDSKLDKSDAKFIDVVHTNALVKGKAEPSGHVDFYANSGSSQPGCENEENANSCNHVRAPEYYAESINSKKGFWGVKSPALICKILDTCDIQIMGFYTPHDARGIYNFKTNDRPPYALGKGAVEESKKS